MPEFVVRELNTTSEEEEDEKDERDGGMEEAVDTTMDAEADAPEADATAVGGIVDTVEAEEAAHTARGEGGAEATEAKGAAEAAQVPRERAGDIHSFPPLVHARIPNLVLA